MNTSIKINVLYSADNADWSDAGWATSFTITLIYIFMKLETGREVSQETSTYKDIYFIFQHRRIASIKAHS